MVAVSLKMYLNHDATLAWAHQIAQIVRSRPCDQVEVVILPSFPSLSGVASTVAGTAVRLGAQNLSEYAEGPYTGEVDAASLVQIGCRYVEIGHAERRRRYGEEEPVVGRKLAAALRAGLIPLLCLGETERTGSPGAAHHCVDQLGSALSWVPDDLGEKPLVIAYEPIWAIGADQPAGLEHIQSVCVALRDFLDQSQPTRPVRLVYGGSAGPGLLSQLGEAVDGLFLGRFAHQPSAFATILQEATERVTGAARAQRHT
jgi:triosephosphate isomerase